MSVKDNVFFNKSTQVDSVILNLLDDNFQADLIIKDYPPVSINTARKFKEKIKAAELIPIKRKGTTIFQVRGDDNQFHFLSTNGGYLQVNLITFEKNLKTHNLLKSFKIKRVLE